MQQRYNLARLPDHMPESGEIMNEKDGLRIWAGASRFSPFSMLLWVAWGMSVLCPFFFVSGHINLWWSLFFWILLLFPASEDGATGYVSDGWSLSLGLAGAAHHFFDPASGNGFLLVIVILFGLYWLFPGSMGEGDLFLAGAAALWLSLPASILFLWISFVAGGIAGTLLILFKRRKITEGIPFIPFLCLGGGMAYALEELADRLWLCLFR